MSPEFDKTIELIKSQLSSINSAASMMRWVIGLLLFVCFQVASHDTIWVLTKHDINRVYDGDTFFINLKGLPPVLGHDLSIRVADMDAPELRSRCDTPERRLQERTYGAMSRDHLIGLIENSESIVLHNLRRDSFFRIIADVLIDGDDLKDIMVKDGFAHYAVGGLRGGWCEDPRVTTLKID